MSDNTKSPRSRRPSYLRGPVAPAGPVPISAQPEAQHAPQEAQPQDTGKEEPKEDVQLYSWKVWLLPRRPFVGVIVVAALAGCLVASYWAFPQPFFLAVIGVILVNRLAPFLFPVKYVLTEQTAGYRTFLARDVRQWDKIFTYREYPDGVLLANDFRTVRGRFREGLFMYFETGAANRDEVMKIVTSKLKPLSEILVEKPEGNEFKGGISSAFRRLKRLRKKDQDDDSEEDL